jgi:hypothetical protein
MDGWMDGWMDGTWHFVLESRDPTGPENGYNCQHNLGNT